MPEPRYRVLELTGYALSHGSAAPSTDVMVLDTWHCWREVWVYRATRYGPRLRTRRMFAEHLAQTLNAEHEKALAS